MARAVGALRGRLPKGAHGRAFDGDLVRLHAIEVPWRDPLDAFERVAGRRWPILLDSAGPVGALARWSFVACDPLATLIVPDRSLERDGRVDTDLDPLAAVRELVGSSRLDPADGAVCAGVRPPFLGGVMGFIAYDAAELFERIPPPRDPVRRVPDIAFGRYAAVVAFDRARGRAWAIGSASDFEAPAGAPGGRAAAELRARSIAALLADAPPGGGPGDPAPPIEIIDDGRSLRAADRPSVEAAIGRAVEYVHAGDIFQANLSQAFELDLRPDEDPATVYRRARALTPAPFGAVLRFDEIGIVSVSPERFIRSDGSSIEARPIKGTRPRGADPKLDRAEADALTASAKDRSENVMIVDLMRNDLSRVCQSGSVRVDSLCALESHPTVHHLVSTISGRLRPGVDPVDVLRATFPAGSITGAPKVRAMEIIAEIEGRRRGVYCGSIGYIGFDGTFDFNVAIRTIVMRAGRAEIRAGGGIVADSTPAAEFDEMLDKARALLGAFGIARPGARGRAARGADAGAAFSPGTVPVPVPVAIAAPAPPQVPVPGAASECGSGSASLDGPTLGIGADEGGGAARRRARRDVDRAQRILVIDNYDSFVHTIARYVRELGAAAQVVRNDAVDLEDIAALDPTHIIISPGPGTPLEAGISIELIRRFGPRVPILGICLGHQAIAAAYGGAVVRGAWPAHGRRSLVWHDGAGILSGVPSPFGVGRYHSLVVDPSALPGELEVIAEDEAGVIMALRHRIHPTTGVQFHPESVMTDHGHSMLAEFLAVTPSPLSLPMARNWA